MFNNKSAKPVESQGRLQARFAAAVDAVGGASDGGETFQSLAARYTEPHRHYHNLEHIDACLAWLDWFAGSAQRRDEVELALWFHDAVYEPGSADNERVSADLARRGLGALGVSAASIERITNAIIATASHEAPVGDAALVVDIDLAILGATPRAFQRFEQQIRLEHAHVSEEAYRRGRSAVLQGFLSREHIFTTSAVATLLESRARTNLRHAFAGLSGAER